MVSIVGRHSVSHSVQKDLPYCLCAFLRTISNILVHSIFNLTSNRIKVMKRD